MFKMKKIIGMVLTVAMVLSMIPATVFAADTEYSGIELRVPSVGHGDSIANTTVTLKATTDTVHYGETNDLAAQNEWYYMVRDLSQLPEADRAAYTEIQYDGIPAYIKPIETDATWDASKQYVLKTTVNTQNGATLSSNLAVEGENVILHEHNTSKAVFIVEIMPEESAPAIGEFDFIVDQYGYVTVAVPENNFTYIYRVLDGSYDPMVFNSPVGQTLQTVSVNNADYKELAGAINITNNPQVIMLKVSRYEWENHKTSAVYAYGIYTVPLSMPTITVDRLEFGTSPFMITVGSAIVGNYSSNIAQAEFKGWFADEEGTVVAPNEQDAFIVFTVRSAGLFADGLVATDFSLTCSETSEAYTGSYMKQLSPNEYQVSFSIPTNRISITLKEVGAGGNLEFHDYPTKDVISMMPFGDSYEKVSVDLYIKPGYYLKSLTINGKELDDSINPFKEGTLHQIPNNQDYYNGFRFVPETNTVIEAVFAPADTIIIDYGNYIPVFTGDMANEVKWHDNATYFVSETYNTQLCHIDSLIDENYSQSIQMLNTKPDGTGISVPVHGNYFVWEPTTEYANGVAETITLYAIMRCDTHLPENWNYEPAMPATCTTEGVKAHRYCDLCNAYELETPDGYVACSMDDVVIPKLPHDFTKYQDNGNGTHTVTCSACPEYRVEEHTHVDGLCKCGNRKYVPGDMNEDGAVTDADAVYLLYYTIFSEDFPIYQPADFNGDGVVTDADAIHLLYHTIFPEDYPIN